MQTKCKKLKESLAQKELDISEAQEKTLKFEENMRKAEEEIMNLKENVKKVSVNFIYSVLTNNYACS